jgi:hypothetical protein
LIRLRVSLSYCVMVTVLGFAPTLAAAQYAPSGLTGAQLKQLHQLNMPIVAPVPAPRGFHVTRVVPNAYDRTYKIYYQNKLGATIVFQGDELFGSTAAPASGSSAAVATSAPATEPKRPRGFLQKLFTPSTKAPATPSTTSNAIRGTSSETEGQAVAALMADSELIGPIRFVPFGPCLQGTADASKGQIRGLRVTVVACNFDNPSPLISAYKSVRRQ